MIVSGQRVSGSHRGTSIHRIELPGPLHVSEHGAVAHPVRDKRLGGDDWGGVMLHAHTSALRSYRSRTSGPSVLPMADLGEGASSRYCARRGHIPEPVRPSHLAEPQIEVGRRAERGRVPASDNRVACCGQRSNDATRSVEMPILLILIVVVIAVGLGAAVGSASTYLVGAFVGVAAAIALLAVVGGIAAWRNPSDREDGAPERRFEA